MRKKIFCTGPTRAAKAEQKSLVPARTNQRRKDPFHLYSLSPHSPQFQQSAGATLRYSLPGWPVRFDLDCDGRSVFPALLDHTICSGKSCLAARRWHFSSCCYLEQKIVFLNVQNQQSWPISRMAGTGELSLLTATWIYVLWRTAGQ